MKFYLLIFLSLIFISCKKNSDVVQYVLKSDKTSLNFSGNLTNSKDSFNIESNVAWTITGTNPAANWYSLSTTSGSGNAKVYVTLANNTGATRSTTVTLSSPGMNSVTITISQGQENFIVWGKLFGGSLQDQFADVIQTSDGAFVAAGTSYSSNGDITQNKGRADFLMAKFDASGGLLWQRTFGGTNLDSGSGVVETTDGGYLFAGVTSSINGDVAGNHGADSTSDFWCIKLDKNGNLLWKKTYGGSGREFADSIIKTNDGGFVISGTTTSNDGDVSGIHLPVNTEDIWILKIDANGNKVWQKCLGGSKGEARSSIISTTDGGYLLSAITLSSDGDVTINKGASDIWVVKLNSFGNIIWQKTFGGSGYDRSRGIINTSDGGFAVASDTESADGDVTLNHGKNDIWILKFNSAGTLMWQKSYGGSGDDGASKIIQNADGSYIVAGGATTPDGDVTGTHEPISYGDIWILKIDVNGNKVWQRCLGGSFIEQVNGFIALPNREYLLAGYTGSNNGDMTGLGLHGDIDGWLCKFKDQ
jgi:hypothetical protein